jgi:hypothetical protein
VAECLNSLERKDATEINEELFKKFTAFTKEIEKCPSEGCEYVYVEEKCPWKAKTLACPNCLGPLAAPRPPIFQSTLASFFLLMSSKCPKCDIPIEKISGCPHMTCPCGHHFCWHCYKDHPSGTLKRLYPLHSLAECIFIVLSKGVLIGLAALSLLVAAEGNWVLRYGVGVMAVMLGVLLRVLLLDGSLLFLVMFWMMRNRRSFHLRPSFNCKFIIWYLLPFLAVSAVVLHLVG